MEILNGTWLGDLKESVVGNYDDEALGRSDGDLVGRSEKGFQSVHQMGPRSGRLGERLDAQMCQNQGCWLMRKETPALKDEICC